MDLNAQLKSGETEGGDNLNMPAGKDKAGSSKSPKGKTPSKLPRSKEAPKPKKKINFGAVLNWVIFFVIVIILAYIGYLTYNAFTYQPTSTVEEIKLSDDKEIIQRIDSSIEPGKEVSTSESGYGRDNPFANY